MITEMGRDLQKIDDDILYAKRLIQERLCQDLDIIKYLHNEELERCGAEPEDYFGQNILPYVRIPGTLDKVKNFIEKCNIPCDAINENAPFAPVVGGKIFYNVFYGNI